MSVPHTASDHEKDGGMEVDVTGLMGILADRQRPLPHSHNDDSYGSGGQALAPLTLIMVGGAGSYMILPVLTTAEIGDLTPAESMTVWDSTTEEVKIYDGAAWLVYMNTTDHIEDTPTEDEADKCPSSEWAYDFYEAYSALSLSNMPTAATGDIACGDQNLTGVGDVTLAAGKYVILPSDGGLTHGGLTMDIDTVYNRCYNSTGACLYGGLSNTFFTANANLDGGYWVADLTADPDPPADPATSARIQIGLDYIYIQRGTHTPPSATISWTDIARFSMTDSDIRFYGTSRFTDTLYLRGNVTMDDLITIDGRDPSVDGAKLDTIDSNADVTADNDPKAHAASHTDGTDDIQDATAAQKGLATAAQITKLDGIEAGATVGPVSELRLSPKATSDEQPAAWAWTAAALYLGGVLDKAVAADGDYVTWVRWMDAGTWTIQLISQKRADNGIVDIYIDATEYASFDLYNAATQYDQKSTDTGNVIATSGFKTIKLLVDGKNASSSAYRTRFNELQLWRTA